MSFKNSKKAIATQSFNIITAVLIMGVILIFGAYSVVKLVDNSKMIEDAQFKSELDDEINQITSKYGSVRYVKINSLKGMNYFCIFDLDKTSDALNLIETHPYLKNYPLLIGDLEDKVANIFVLSNSKIEARMFNEKINLKNDESFICTEVPATGRVILKLEGKGKYALVSFAEDQIS